MKHHLLALAVVLMLLSAMLTSCSNANASGNTTPAVEPDDSAIVYVTRDLSPEALVRIYEAVAPVDIMECGEHIGLGSRKYVLKSID